MMLWQVFIFIALIILYCIVCEINDSKTEKIYNLFLKKFFYKIYNCNLFKKLFFFNKTLKFKHN